MTPKHQPRVRLGVLTVLGSLPHAMIAKNGLHAGDSGTLLLLQQGIGACTLLAFRWLFSFISLYQKPIHPSVHLF